MPVVETAAFANSGSCWELSEERPDFNQDEAFLAQTATWDIYYRRFGHLGYRSLCNLYKVTTLDSPVPQPDHDNHCMDCALANLTRSKGPLAQRSDERLGRIHVDICGPFKDAVSKDGHRYWLEIVDSFSGYHWVIPLGSRGDAPQALECWKLKAERQSGCQLKAARSDGARELVGLFKKWEKEEGILIETTEPYNSLQNGRAERSIRTSEERIRVMIQSSRMLVEFWNHALGHQAIVRNVLPNGPTVDGFTLSPLEAFTGKKPSVDYLRE